MKKTFNDFVEESRKELEIIDSKTLDSLIKEKQDYGLFAASSTPLA